MVRYSLVIMFVLVISSSCQNKGYYDNPDTPVLFRNTVKQLTDIIVHDIFSPPVASRIYAYPSIAAYEVMAVFDSSYHSLSGQLNGLTAIPLPLEDVKYDLHLASLAAFIKVGRGLVYSEEFYLEYQNSLFQEFRDKGMPAKVYKRSIEYGERVADHILSWADGDGYRETRTYPKYTIQETPGSWKPTPPDYMEGIEPHWNKIRPFVIDSSSQFIPDPTIAFSTDKDSQFYKDVMEVYETVNTLTGEQEAIAQFWDCNPYVSHHQGHMMFATKKITPGGHWIGITSIATSAAGSDYGETVEAFARVSIALADAFISCWDEKWRSILIRPETVINQYIDEDWLPVLQTPPFPEYTSGHSVISRAAAVILTDFYGDNFHLVDSSEVEYGLPVREFDSFFDAADEAAISRLYGGIHYRPAIDEGVRQGDRVGKFILSILRTSNVPIASFRQ